MIVLIRHEHTDMAGRFCGHSDPPLSPRGLAQLVELNHRVSRYPFTHIFSSDLQRARQTAASLSRQNHLPIHELPSLREIAFGEWEGLSWEQILTRDPAYAQRWLNCWPAVAPPDGEEFAGFARRIQHAMNSIADDVQNGCAAVVTHAGVIRTFLTNIDPSMEGLELSAYDYGSCWEVCRGAGNRWVAGARTARRQMSPATEALH